MKSASSAVLAVAVGGFLQLALVSCTPRTASGPATTDELEANEEDLQRLRALPYVAWDEGADPELRGVLSWDESRAWSGYNLYTNDVDEAYLMDMGGRRVHRWKLPKTRRGNCEHVELLEDGEILVICVNDGAFHLDWASRVLAETTIGVHHDAAVMPDGRRVIPFHDGRYIHRRRLVWFDGLAWLNSELELVDRWSSFERLDDLTPHHARSPLEKPGSWSRLLANTGDYYHLNSVESLPATDLGARDPRFRSGQLMLCFRNTDLIVILDQDSHDVVWSWGPGELDGPHMPTLLPSGNILVFDNGTRRRYSRSRRDRPHNQGGALGIRGGAPRFVLLCVARVGSAAGQRQHSYLRSRERARLRSNAGRRDRLGVLESGARQEGPQAHLPHDPRHARPPGITTACYLIFHFRRFRWTSSM